jgi:hypothetical protein
MLVVGSLAEEVDELADDPLEEELDLLDEDEPEDELEVELLLVAMDVTATED